MQPKPPQPYTSARAFCRSRGRALEGGDERRPGASHPASLVIAPCRRPSCSSFFLLLVLLSLAHAGLVLALPPPALFRTTLFRTTLLLYSGKSC